MSAPEFSIGPRKYKIGKMDAFKQFHIVRRIAPILGELIPAASKMKSKNASQITDQDYESLAPIMNGIAMLSDEDANKVLLGLCSCVEIYQETSKSWARVSTDSNLMFQDLELVELLQIAGRAFVYNMKGFFTLLPQVSAGQ